MDWTEFFRDAVRAKDIQLVKPFMESGQERQWGPDTVKPCRIIPCPGSYFPCHDEQCEAVWEPDDEGLYYPECACEPRARARRDGLTEDL